MDELGISAARLGQLLDAQAAYIVKRTSPLKDELSQRAAFRDYGRGWIKANIANGNLVARPRGNRLVLSRAEIETLRAVENSPKIKFK